MALLFATDARDLGVGAFDAIWEHYFTAKFLYPAKLARLAPALSLIRAGWPQLLEAPSELFQFHAASSEDRIVSSICAYRDTSETYVVQHAASQGQPLAMLNCIQECLTTINADPSFEFARMYFRPENRWPTRASRAIADAMAETHSSFTTDEYLVCDLYLSADTLGETDPDDSVYDLLSREQPDAYALAVAAVGELRARALGMEHADLTLRALNQRYMEHALRRTRRMLAIHRDGALAGIALCHASSVPMNFSYLCNRTEILVHPDAPEKEHLVAVLARASIREAAARGDRLSVLLISATYADAALQAGYTHTHKQYASFLWAREDERGASSALVGVERLYAAASRLSSRITVAG